MHHLPYTRYELLWLFLIYSFLGWCAGVVVSSLKRKKFINTGVLNLPLCPVYGFSAVLSSTFLLDLKDLPVFLFIGGAVSGSVLAVGTGAVLEHIFHRKWKDYSEYRFGFGGHLSIWHVLLFGAAAIFVLWVGNPLILHVVSLIPYGLGRPSLYGALILVGLDLSSVLAVVWKWRRYVNRVSGMAENMHLVSEVFGHAITQTMQRRLERVYPNIETTKILEAKATEPPKEKVCFAEGCGFYKLVWLFLIGALLGDLIETVFCRMTMGWWMSRSSVLYGPFSVVWGLGCALLSAFLYAYRNKSDSYIFVYGTVVGGVYEYVCSVFSEIVFGTVFWDYSAIPFNIGGRVNLLYCFFWEIAAVIWLKWVYPFLSNLIERIPRRIGPVLTWILIVLMAANMAVSGLALARYSARQTDAAPGHAIDQFLDEHYPDERMERVYPKAKFVS